MKKIYIFLIFAGIVFTGCSEKTVYPQVSGNVVFKKPKYVHVFFDKKKLLNEVDQKAKNVFLKISKERKNIKILEKNIIINKIYREN